MSSLHPIRLTVAALLFASLSAPAVAQEVQIEPLTPTPLEVSPADPETEGYILNLRDTEIALLAEQVSQITGRTLVLDPSLSGNVTVISSTELDREGIWTLFQSILRSRGYVAVQTGILWEVVPEAEARTRASDDASALGDQDFVTRLLRLNRLPSAEAVRVLGPLVSDSGYIEAVVDPNAIVITDTAANVTRLFDIATTFDSDANTFAQVLRFQFAQAAQVGAAIREVLGEAGTGARLSVDPGSNTLLIRGSEADIEQIRRLASAMDVPAREDPTEEISTSIYELSYADAETIVQIIQSTVRGGTDITNVVAREVGEGEAATTVTDTIIPSEIAVSASTETNAVVIRGTDAQIAEVRHLIKSLDKQRPQVMIEAAIVEVSGDVADRLGVQLGLGDGIPSGGFAATSFNNSGTSLASIVAALGVPGAAALGAGTTLGLGSDPFAVLVQALSQSTQANLLSTPSVTTLDNRPATIVVGQNVPFRTGSFATDGNTLVPFTTIERRDVGITMEVLPRVTAGGIVRLDIAQEVSSLANSNLPGAADLITNRRVINTTVEARDGGTVVLGGLITDDSQNTESKVPGLGDLPLVGNVFRSRSRDTTRRTLFVFLRPRVLTNQHQATDVAQDRLQRLRAAETTTTPPARLSTNNPEIKKLPLEINGLY